jgi:hypothetical protein
MFPGNEGKLFVGLFLTRDSGLWAVTPCIRRFKVAPCLEALYENER